MAKDSKKKEKEQEKEPALPASENLGVPAEAAAEGPVMGAGVGPETAITETPETASEESLEEELAEGAGADAILSEMAKDPAAPIQESVLRGANGMLFVDAKKFAKLANALVLGKTQHVTKMPGLMAIGRMCGAETYAECQKVWHILRALANSPE